VGIRDGLSAIPVPPSPDPPWGAWASTDNEQGVRTTHVYLDAGGTLLDTGDFHGSGHSEWLIHLALSSRDREDVVL
jgi:aryl-alcohol dehydrogenase-like predicted oxidoreductase